jgi:hypothetical protein
LRAFRFRARPPVVHSCGGHASFHSALHNHFVSLTPKLPWTSRLWAFSPKPFTNWLSVYRFFSIRAVFLTYLGYRFVYCSGVIVVVFSTVLPLMYWTRKRYTSILSGSDFFPGEVRRYRLPRFWACSFLKALWFRFLVDREGRCFIFLRFFFNSNPGRVYLQSRWGLRFLRKRLRSWFERLFSWAAAIPLFSICFHASSNLAEVLSGGGKALASGFKSLGLPVEHDLFFHVESEIPGHQTFMVGFTERLNEPVNRIIPFFN